MKRRIVLPLFLSALIAAAAAPAAATETVRIGLLQFGTVNWEIDTIIHNRLDQAEGIRLEPVMLAGNDATRIALLAGDVDIIVSDWLFVSRQRAEGNPLTFVPYSTSLGALMAPAEGPVRTLAELRGRKIGVAGSALDKSWLMIRGLVEAREGFDPATAAEPVFGAPPLIAEKLRQGELDAALNFWHYNARLEAEGYRTLVGAQEAARALGAQGDISAIGYVFADDWAAAHPAAARGFVRASRAAKALLVESDAEWERLKPLVKAENDAVFATLRQRYREGVPDRPLAEEERDTAKVYEFLARIGGEKLVGPASVMADGTFWTALKHGF